MVMKGLMKLLAISLVMLLSMGFYMAAKLDAEEKGGYTPLDKEFYLTPEQIAFIRPGLDLEILDIEVPSDRRPVVTFSVTDPAGMPLDYNGVFTPGPISVRFAMSYYPPGERQLVNYHGDSRDRNGIVEEVGDGVFTYKFTTELPADWNPDATQALAGSARRDLGDFELPRYYDNDFYNWVPSGASEPWIREVVTTTTCNKCHDQLAMHGSNYRDVQFCMQCHTETLVDDGVSYSFNVMVHRVHMELEGEYPPGVGDCQVCHVGASPDDKGVMWNVPTVDFPLVADPNPVQVCDASGAGSTKLTWKHSGPVEIRIGTPGGKLVAKAGREGSLTTGKWVNNNTVLYLIDATSGNTVQRLPLSTTVLGCAGNAPGAMIGMAASQHTAWLSYPTRSVCGSCHTDVNFETGEGHSIGIPQPDDQFCSTCHPGTSTTEYDTTIPGAHTVEYKSKQLGGVLVKLKSVTNAGPGKKPAINFSLFNKYGRLDPAELGRLRFSINGPNEDFDFYAQEESLGKLTPKGSDWAYTFNTPLPVDAEGSFTVGVEGRINAVVINEGKPNEFEARDVLQATTMAFAVTGDKVTPRRLVVDDARCEACHANLSLHGGGRNNANYCITCHMPEATDEEERDPEDYPLQSIAMKYMIHKIHAGAELEYGYVVIGHNGSVNDFGEVEYPGDLANCETCHVPGSYVLPLAEGLLPTVTPRDFYTPMEAAAGACLACHDSKDSAAHAISNTNFLGEACAACHGSGKEASVERVHAR